MIAATKNAICRFMKEKLKMDEKTRNSVKIVEIFPSRSETSSIIYIKCMSPDDIATITYHAKNLPRTNFEDNPPALVPYIPKEFYARYQGLEKTLWQIRRTIKDSQTNIRLGRTDYIIRFKSKNYDTKWSHIIPMKIPSNIPPPQLEDKLYKQQETEKDKNEKQ